MARNEKSQCPVCANDVPSKKLHKCHLCNYETCRDCFARYIETSSDDPHCMSCRRPVTRDQICETMSKNYVNGRFKKRREVILFNRELAMMPSTQPYVEQEIQRRKNEEVLNSLYSRKLELRLALAKIEQSIREVSHQLVPKITQVERRDFVQRCANPSCNGFLSISWKCGSCEGHTCKHCGVFKGVDALHDHVCSEDDMQTMQLLRSDCKKCPGCGTFIHKISGCDQMWCVSCHTAFSWRTGSKVNGHIHNPHFYEFQRGAYRFLNREAGDVPCGGRPTYGELTRALSFIRSTREYDTIMTMHRITNHIDDIERPRYPTDIDAEQNLDLRIRYMMNELDADTFMSKVQQREKARFKKAEIGHIFVMLVDVMSDTFRNMVLNKEKAVELMHELVELVNYSNREMYKISRRFECVVPIINLQDQRNLMLSRKWNQAEAHHTALVMNRAINL